MREKNGMKWGNLPQSLGLTRVVQVFWKRRSVQWALMRLIGSVPYLTYLFKLNSIKNRSKSSTRFIHLTILLQLILLTNTVPIKLDNTELTELVLILMQVITIIIEQISHQESINLHLRSQVKSLNIGLNLLKTSHRFLKAARLIILNWIISGVEFTRLLKAPWQLRHPNNLVHHLAGKTLRRLLQ